MTNNQGKNLRSYVKSLQQTDEEFASFLGISRSTLIKWYNREELTPNDLKKLTDKGIDINNPLASLVKSTENIGIPIYDVDVTAGAISLGELNEGNIIGQISHPSYRNLQGFVKVTGDSMMPEFRPGDYIGFKRVEDISIIQYGQAYIIETADNQRMLKILKKGTKKDSIILHSLNPKYEDFEVHLKKINHIFIVLAKIGGF